MAATLIMRLITGSIRKESDPSSVLPLWSPRAPVAQTSPITLPAGERMPPSFTDHCLHSMEIGRSAPMVAVSVRPPGKV